MRRWTVAIVGAGSIGCGGLSTFLAVWDAEWSTEERLRVSPAHLCPAGDRALVRMNERVVSLDLRSGRSRGLALSAEGAFTPGCAGFVDVRADAAGVSAWFHRADGSVERELALEWDPSWLVVGGWQYDHQRLVHRWTHEAQAFDARTGRAIWGWAGTDLQIDWLAPEVGGQVAFPCDHTGAPVANGGVCVLHLDDGRVDEYPGVAAEHVALGASGVWVLGPDALRLYDLRSALVERWELPLSGEVDWRTELLVEGGFGVLGHAGKLMVVDEDDGRVLYERPKGARASVGGGWVAWHGQDHRVHALELATGEEQVVLTVPACGIGLPKAWPCWWTDLRMAPPYVVLGDTAGSGAWRLR